MKRIGVLIFSVLLLLAATGIGASMADDSVAATNLQFAELLAQKLGIALPVKTPGMADSAYFSALAASLSAKNINNFSNVAFDAKVSCTEVADVLYSAVGGKENLDTNGKLNFLTSNKYLTCTLDPNADVKLSDLNNIISSPAFSSLVAEAYSAPVAPAGRDPAFNTPGVTTEDTSSKI